MHFFIHKLKISNFLSFFGEYEVNFKPFTAVMCNYYEGKDDFLRSIEFVFGADLTEIRIDSPIDLIHKVLRKEFLDDHNIQSYVEVTINFVHDKKFLKFRKSLKNGNNMVRIEHKVSDIITTKLFYDEKLASLGLNTQHKNIIFYKKYFNNMIWGSSGDLEKTISACLRAKFEPEDLKKARKEVDYLTRLRARTAKLHFNSIKKSHSVLAQFTKKYEMVYSNKEKFKEEILRDLANSTSDEDFSQMSDDEEVFTETIGEAQKLQKLEKIKHLEAKCDTLTKKLDDLKSEKAALISQLYHEEIILSLATENPEILQNRIIKTKSNIQKKENELSLIWFRIDEVTSDIENLSNQISESLAFLRESQKKIFLQSRYTAYGRFKDYIKPGSFLHLLKKIVGPEIWYANFCNSLEDALYVTDFLKMLKLEHREAFICFENYSHKLKDILIASGEKGVETDTLEQLLIFLCKLKHYNLINEVPVMIQEDFNYDNFHQDGSWFYMHNNVLFTEQGCIIYECDDDSHSLETDSEILQDLIQLQKKEEYKYNEWRHLLSLKLDALLELNSLENDIRFLKKYYKKPFSHPDLDNIIFWKTEIYEEYADIFKACTENWKRLEKETQEQYSSREIKVCSRLSESSKESTALILLKLEQVITQIRETQNELGQSDKELKEIFSGPFHSMKIEKKVVTLFQNFDKTKLFFEKEFKRLQKLMTEDDFEDFIANQDWRKCLINSLVKDFNKIKTKLRDSTNFFETIKSLRDEKFNPLLQHLDRYLTSTFKHILDNALPFIKLSYSARDEKLQLMSSLREGGANLTDIKHFNTFLKFISTLSVFLELAVHEKVPVIIFEDFEEYFPKHEDDLTSILDPTTIEKIIPDDNNPRFQLLMRVGQYLAHYIKKNTPSVNVREIETNKDYINGPMQIICFSEEDFINAVDHHIWIHSQMLPDEYLSEECDSYSEIHKLEFDNLMS